VNRLEIVELAQQCGIGVDGVEDPMCARLQRFAEVAAERQREASAHTCEQMGIEGFGTLAIAVAIRKGGLG